MIHDKVIKLPDYEDMLQDRDGNIGLFYIMIESVGESPINEQSVLIMKGIKKDYFGIANVVIKHTPSCNQIDMDVKYDRNNCSHMARSDTLKFSGKQSDEDESIYGGYTSSSGDGTFKMNKYRDSIFARRVVDMINKEIKEKSWRRVC